MLYMAEILGARGRLVSQCTLHLYYIAILYILMIRYDRVNRPLSLFHAQNMMRVQSISLRAFYALMTMIAWIFVLVLPTRYVIRTGEAPIWG